MIESRILRCCHVENFTEPRGVQAIRERLCRQTVIEENRTRIRKLRSLVQRLKCPSPVHRPIAPVKEKSRYEEIVYPPVTYHGHCSEMFPEKPEPTPQDTFMCAKVYRNKRTQVRKPETFAFEVEVQPYLEVLVGTSVKQAMDEAINENEMVVEQALRHDFRAWVKIERAEITRLSEKDKRLIEEKGDRDEQFPVGCEQLMERASVADPLVNVKGFDGDLVANVLEGFYPREYQVDVIKKELEATISPLILDKLAVTPPTKGATRGLLTEMVTDILVNRSQAYDVTDATGCCRDDEEGVLKYDEEWQIVEDEDEGATSDDSEIVAEFATRMGLMTPDYVQTRQSSFSSRRRPTLAREVSSDKKKIASEVPSPSIGTKKSSTSITSSADSWSAVIHEYDL